VRKYALGKNVVNIYFGDTEEEHVKFGFIISRPILKGGSKMPLELNCTNEEKIKITVKPVTKGGNPVLLDGPVSVIVQSGEGTFELVDGSSFYVVSGNNPGDTAFLISGDADLGEGVQSIADTIVLKVAGALAENLGLSASVPEMK